MTKDKQFAGLLFIVLGLITGSLSWLLIQYSSMGIIMTIVIVAILIYCAYIFPNKNSH